MCSYRGHSEIIADWLKNGFLLEFLLAYQLNLESGSYSMINTLGMVRFILF